MISITDEQANKLKDSVQKFIHTTNYTLDYASNDLFWIVNSLTKEQRIALVEEIGLGVVEWKEFDSEDESTWPDDDRDVLVNVVSKLGKDSFVTIDFKAQDDWFHFSIDHEVYCITHWCELPKPPKEK